MELAGFAEDAIFCFETFSASAFLLSSEAAVAVDCLCLSATSFSLRILRRSYSCCWTRRNYSFSIASLCSFFFFSSSSLTFFISASFIFCSYHAFALALISSYFFSKTASWSVADFLLWASISYCLFFSSVILFSSDAFLIFSDSVWSFRCSFLRFSSDNDYSLF